MLAVTSNEDKSITRFTYIGIRRLIETETREHKQHNTQPAQAFPDNLLNKYLEIIGREVLRDEIPSLDEIEKKLQAAREKLGFSSLHEINNKQKNGESLGSSNSRACTIIAELEKKGYLKDSSKWLGKKGFLAVGERLLRDVMRAINKGEFGIHETMQVGSGSVVLDSSHQYEVGNDLSFLNVPKSVFNAVERASKSKQKAKIPIDITLDDFEQYETKLDVRTSIAYCIDLSSTMRYSTMYGDMSRIEAAKRALWSLYLLNQKFFSTDSIYLIGFGALASKVTALDIPYLKTFQPGYDFLHYTNYQAAFRLARRMLQKENSQNRRIVMITDGHPSACFVDSIEEKEKILSQRPYSQFYSPERHTLEKMEKTRDLKLDMYSGTTVYLCYRYRQVDQYIGEKTILEARKCRNMGIEVDTIMISEEDTLLSYVNELEKIVKGRSYYINPAEIDKVLLSDYLNNKKMTLSSHTKL